MSANKADVKIRITFSFTLLSLLCISTVRASDRSASDSLQALTTDQTRSVSASIRMNPGVVLALSGGGVRGFAHIGVIKALEEAEIPIDGIAGTSIGAIVGSFYAAGYTVVEMEELVREVDWSSIFLDSPQRKSLPLSSKSAQSRYLLELQFKGTQPYIPSALVTGQTLSNYLIDKLYRAPYRGEPDFDHLKVPFIAVATDLKSGDRVLFRDGDLAEAILASMALPLLITPVQYQDHLLIDGGVAENIPVFAARDLGDPVVAVDVTMPPVLGPQPHQPWVIANQVTGLMAEDRNRDLLAQADIAISPLPDSLTTFTFVNPDILIDLGYRATRELIPLIKERLSIRSDVQNPALVPVKNFAFRSSQNAAITTGDSRVFSKMRAGEFPTRGDIHADLQRLQQEQEFRQVRAEISGDTLIYILEDNPAILSLEFSGVKQITEEALYNIVTAPTGLKPGFKLSDIDTEALLHAYRNRGNPLAKIDRIQIDEKGDLILHIDEGIIRDIHVEGNKIQSSGRILRDLQVKAGEPLNLSDLTTGLEELHGSNLFTLVRATLVNQVLTIKVQERPRPRLRLGAGVDSERKGRGLVEFSYESMPLLGGSLTAWIKYAEFDERYELTYRNLAILKTYLEGSCSLISSRTEYNYYDSDGGSLGLYHFDRRGGTAQLGMQFRTWGRLLIGLHAERVRTDHAPSSPELDLRKLFLRSEFDTQDRTDYPTTGLRYDFLLESAPSALGSEVSFQRIYLQVTRVIPITHRLTFLGTLQGGICDQATPFSEWFRLGGDRSFSGLHQDEISGRQLVNVRIEFREDLLSRILADAYISIIGDLGNIWEDLEADVNSGDFKQGVGLKFSLDTFLGPMSISYGHLYSRNNLKSRDLLYFNIGHYF